MNASRTARERVRAELVGEIKEAARRQLAVEGAAGLSLRAVARELGMVSSAIYRYFPSRDELLTALIIEAFDAVGAAVEEADAACPRDAYLERWMAACRAIRTWALAHPHEYALIHGSPVPGYVAPRDTAAAAARDGIVMAAILGEAHRAGRLAPHPQGLPPTPPSFAEDAAGLRESLFFALPDEVIMQAVMAWTSIYGVVSFELFGMYNNVITDTAAAFDHHALCQARLLGFGD
ncbi:TetR family transcriptional regulator [Sphaerisporangium krabiense]|uniref:AcrR family transcriptional regulator n=1 Tax=Sphaerisporangium krabiense TaxID=763782 RepID=A0A7W8Z7K2_9ACTN|nr:TetR/AcrR family transcriptional regulator [Sphaerisporangium krabiense]MBB5628819.1 AcrR family transcriptional regulator [Sphaerisporangium krabiense]GII60339.1 TetR family transcriptional regulator [Sphaerisporangium krabiense]